VFIIGGKFEVLFDGNGRFVIRKLSQKFISQCFCQIVSQRCLKFSFLPSETNVGRYRAVGLNVDESTGSAVAVLINVRRPCLPF